MLLMELFSHVVDERKGSCWLEIRNGQCESNIKLPMLKAECCNTVGKAWGSPCEPCDSTCESSYMGMLH